MAFPHCSYTCDKRRLLLIAVFCHSACILIPAVWTVTSYSHAYDPDVLGALLVADHGKNFLFTTAGVGLAIALRKSSDTANLKMLNISCESRRRMRMNDPDKGYWIRRTQRAWPA
jgi:hypothetical protein